MVGREVSKQPPWSIDTSTRTARRFINPSCSRVTRRGVRAPCTSTAPITRSARGRSSSIARIDEKTVLARPPSAMSSPRSWSTERSSTKTSASIPMAMNAAFIPTTPPPMITTVAEATPGTPPRSTPLPPSGRSSMNAPAWVAILPATSLIGASSGRRPRVSSTVS